ncbi:hypothetical protein GE21DRAFT_1208982 [Neurospora crassa]|nr:hypothetical protein GE21DRAFT_1208982 [Neurospora crassa]
MLPRVHSTLQRGARTLARRRGTYAHYTEPDRHFGARLCPDARTPESLQGS